MHIAIHIRWILYSEQVCFILGLGWVCFDGHDQLSFYCPLCAIRKRLHILYLQLDFFFHKLLS